MVKFYKVDEYHVLLHVNIKHQSNKLVTQTFIGISEYYECIVIVLSVNSLVNKHGALMDIDFMLHFFECPQVLCAIDIFFKQSSLLYVI